MTSDVPDLCRDDEVSATQIAPFWRRIGAAVVDALILGAIGACFGFLWFDQLAALGRTGRFIGGTIALVYFGALNSHIGQGQTLGKRLLKIRVTDAKGEPISLPRSFVRGSILLVPFALNGTLTPPGPYEQLVGVVLSILIFGVGVAQVYLYCCNRRTGQALHDILVGTFVRDAGSTSEIDLKMWKPHLAIAGVLSALVLGVVLLPYTSDPPDFMPQLAEARRLAQSVVPDAHLSIWRKTSKMTTAGSGQTPASWVQLSVEMRVKPENFESIADNIAMAMFRSSSGVGDVGQVVIVISYGYDIIISHARTTKAFAHTPQEWLKRLKIDEPVGATPLE
ncbi:MAG: RDD family protein [Nitrospira sp.]|nr:RDD family protein [Nitrospira sp.]